MSNHSLLIVDDDPTIVEMLYANILWEQIGISVVYKRYGGQAAIDCISQYHPDIVLCDIGMPIKNGLDVLRWVQENGVRTYFIFLTCYDSFEYAREAINLRAFHYLTKPCPLEEVEKIVRKAISELSAEDKNRDVGIRNEEFFRELWNGALPDEANNLQEIISRYDKKIDGGEDYHLVLISVSQDEPVQEGWDLQLFHYAFRHLMQECILNLLTLDYSVFSENNGMTTIVLFSRTDMLTEQQLLENCGRAIHLSKTSLDCLPVMLISQPMKLWQVHKSREELEFALQQVQLYPGEVELAKNIAQTEQKTLNWSQLEMSSFFENWNAQEMEEYLECFLNTQMAQNKGKRVEIMHKTHQDILQIFYSYLKKQGIDASSLFDTHEAYELSRKAETSISGMIAFAKLLLSRTHELVVGNYVSSMVRAAIEYIDSHFQMEEIDRETVAEAVCITPNYLSRIFHDGTGMTLREYITDCRINEAKRRLRDSDDSITDIAYETGFGSASYFSTLFRKLYHVSPLTWRKQNRG